MGEAEGLAEGMNVGATVGVGKVGKNVGVSDRGEGREVGISEGRGEG